MTTSIKAEQIRNENLKKADEIYKKAGKTPEQLYLEREKRWRDTIGLKVPDKVPVTIYTGVFAARYVGLTASATYYDRPAYREAIKKVLLDLEPDTSQAAAGNSGLILELLDPKHQLWPGGNLPVDATYQFVEGEYMKPEEYDLFLQDPSDFMLRYFFPRIYGAAAPLSSLPPLRNITNGYDAGLGFMFLGLFLMRPEFRELGEKLCKVGQELENLRNETRDFVEEVASLGFPCPQGGGGIGFHPFDLVSDHFRGMKGSMLDMFRRSDKLVAACDRIIEWRIAAAIPADQTSRGNPKTQGTPLHRGSDGFMSIKQFEKFYWPGLKRAILANTDLGYIAMPFLEGRYADRLEYLLELPKGKVVCHFEHMDMAKAKAVLGNHLCIMGNVPSSLLITGSAQEVEEHCKNLIKICGKGGGFILTTGSSMDEAKPENARAMIDSVRKYGWN